MLLQDLEAYLATQGPFTQGGLTYSICIGDYPASPDTVITLIELPGKGPIRAMGASLSAPIRERAVLEVLVRGPQEDYAAARAVAEAVYQKLDGLHATLSGRQYDVAALTTPSRDSQDRNKRWLITSAFSVQKERG